MSTPAGSTARSEHWDAVYDSKGPDQVSWFQTEPAVSLQLVDGLGLEPSAPVVDVGGGASTLVDRLLERGHVDLTVLDVSDHALDLARHRLGEEAERVRWETADVLGWLPPRGFALWHDRAVFHFLTDPADRARYCRRAAAGIRPGGHLIVATFAADGPEACSGLPVAHHAPDPAVMITEMARVVRSGGSVALTDCAAHDHEWMRTEQADLWLGFTPEQMRQFFTTAGLVDYIYTDVGTA